MAIALNAWTYCGFGGEHTPREFIDWAAAKGLGGVELTVGDTLSVDTSEADAKELAAYARSRGVALRSLATGAGWGKWLCADSAAERAEAIEFVKRYLRLGSWLGAETVLVVPGATRVAWDPSHAEVSYKNAWAHSTASLRELAPEAERLGVNIGVENVWNRFLLSPMEWKLFLDGIGSERVGIYFDVANCAYFARPEDYPEILGAYIKGVHLKNFTGSDSAGVLHGFGDSVLQGDVDFVRVFAALKSIGYSGPLTVEMIPFCRLPDMTLPDIELASKMAKEIKRLEALWVQTPAQKQ